MYIQAEMQQRLTHLPSFPFLLETATILCIICIYIYMCNVYASSFPSFYKLAKPAEKSAHKPAS